MHDHRGSWFPTRPGPGPIEDRLQRASTSFAAAGRLAAVLPAAVLAPLAAPADPVPAVLAAVLTTATAAGVWLTSGARRTVMVLDVVGLMAIGLLQPELVGVAAAESGAGLVYIAIQMALVAYVVRLPLRWLALLVPALCGSYLVGSLRMPAPGVAGWTSWLVAVALLTLGVRVLLYRAAAQTDGALRSQQGAYRARALAAGRRADEQARLAVLHDTVASTLLMVGSGTVRRDDDWLKHQGRRDLAVLAGAGGAGAGPVTLGGLLAEVAAEGPLPARGRIESDVDPAVQGLVDVPPAVLAAVTGAVREALTNVQRHAGGSAAARLTAGPSDGGGFWVLVADAGAGFDPAGAGGQGRGLRESVLGRCREAGVRASVHSAPGAGTQIRLAWPGPTAELGSTGPQPVSPPIQEPGPARLAQRLRLGVLLVPLTLFCVLEPTVVAGHRDLYRSVPTQYAVLAVLTGVVLVAGALELTGGTGRLARPVLLATAGLAVLASVEGLRPAGLGSAAHWTLTDTGWVVCVVLSRSRPWVVLAALAVGVGLNLMPVLLGARLSEANAVNLVTLAAVIVVIQLAVALSTRTVAGWTEVTQQAVQRDAAMATREEVAIRVHADRARHYRELATRIEPLLHGLAEGTLDPGEAGVQRACALEAARLRRLFAEHDDVADPLLHELRAQVEVAERRGVAVHLVLRGEVPALELPVRRALLDPVAAMLTAATSRARITVFVDAGGEVSLSVLADVPAGAEPSRRPVEVSRIRGEEGLWLNLQADMWVVRATPPDRSSP